MMTLRRLTAACIPGSCPAVYQDGNGDCYVVGKKVRSEDRIKLGLADKIEPDETVSKISPDTLKEALAKLGAD